MTDDTGWMRTLGQAGLLFSLGVTIVPHGSPYAISSLVAALVFGVVAIVGTIAPARTPSNRLANEALVFGAVIASYCLFQAISFPGNPFAHPIWDKANSLLGTSVQAISVEPSSTIAALPALLLPVIAFYAAAHLFDNDRSAERLIKALALLGACFALHGILQMLFFPDGLFVAAKDVESLTGFFVNRNTSGTLLGVSSFACLGWLMTSVSWYDRYGRKHSSPTKINRLDSLIASLCAALCIIGLFLTLSRGALVAWTASCALAVLLLAAYFKGSGLVRQQGRTKWAWSAISLIGGFIMVLTIVEFFGGQTTARLATQGTDLARLCIYTATLHGISDNLPFGTGLGTFAAAFQQYRPPECVGVDKLILRAHNSFLEAFFCFGIAAVPFVGYVYIRSVWTVIGGYRSRARLRHHPVMGIAAITMVTIHSVTDFSLQIAGVATYFACFLGAISTICQVPQRR